MSGLRGWRRGNRPGEVTDAPAHRLAAFAVLLVLAVITGLALGRWVGPVDQPGYDYPGSGTTVTGPADPHAGH